MKITKEQQIKLNNMNALCQELRLGDMLTQLDGGKEVKEKILPYQGQSTAKTVAELVKDFNELLEKLQKAGLMATK